MKPNNVPWSIARTDDNRRDAPDDRTIRESSNRTRDTSGSGSGSRTSYDRSRTNHRGVSRTHHGNRSCSHRHGSRSERRGGSYADHGVFGRRSHYEPIYTDSLRNRRASNEVRSSSNRFLQNLPTSTSVHNHRSDMISHRPSSWRTHSTSSTARPEPSRPSTHRSSSSTNTSHPRHVSAYIPSYNTVSTSGQASSTITSHGLSRSPYDHDRHDSPDLMRSLPGYDSTTTICHSTSDTTNAGRSTFTGSHHTSGGYSSNWTGNGSSTMENHVSSTVTSQRTSTATSHGPYASGSHVSSTSAGYDSSASAWYNSSSAGSSNHTNYDNVNANQSAQRRSTNRTRYGSWSYASDYSPPGTSSDFGTSSENLGDLSYENNYSVSYGGLNDVSQLQNGFPDSNGLLTSHDANESSHKAEGLAPLNSSNNTEGLNTSNVSDTAGLDATSISEFRLSYWVGRDWIAFQACYACSDHTDDSDSSVNLEVFLVEYSVNDDQDDEPDPPVRVRPHRHCRHRHGRGCTRG